MSRSRRSESISETPFDIPQLLEQVENDPKDETTKSTVLYLAYGSNLSAETFKGARGIKPISQVNVLVPSLDLTFDLPGIPYREPCFANTRYRYPEELRNSTEYHKDRWHKGLVGVVYEVSKADYATIIATEGGGASYKDIVVDCYEIPSGTDIVDPHPTNVPFKAHTLFSPLSAPPPPGKSPKTGGRLQRPDPSYAQASARYLKLITDGAAEHSLPREYQDFLSELRPYTITSRRQLVGESLLLAIWAPIIAIVFLLGRVFANDKGKVPKWLGLLTGMVFSGVWASYDNAFKKIFGDGERTQAPKDDGESLVSCTSKENQRLAERIPLTYESRPVY